MTQYAPCQGRQALGEFDGRRVSTMAPDRWRTLVAAGAEKRTPVSAALEARGLWVPAIRPPTVPAGSARLRITLSAAHTEKDVSMLIDGLEQAAKDLE